MGSYVTFDKTRSCTTTCDSDSIKRVYVVYSPTGQRRGIYTRKWCNLQLYKWDKCKYDECDKREDTATGSIHELEVARLSKMEKGAETAVGGTHIKNGKGVEIEVGGI